MHTLSLGTFSIGRVPAATAEMVAEAQRLLPGRVTADGRIVMSFHAFVVKTGRHTILIDTCCNKSRPGREQFDQGKRDFLAGLARLGVQPEAVTHVMCTHLHWDHVGWNTRLENGKWVPTFPNARYVMAKREYEHWDAVYAREGAGPGNIHAMAFEDSVLPIMRAERAVLVADDYELDTGITLAPCHGHTPGHVVVNIASGGRTGVFVGDAIHHPMQLLFPDLSSRADADMNASRTSRRALIEAHADTGNIVLPHHFASPACGTISRDGEAFRFQTIAGS